MSVQLMEGYNKILDTLSTFDNPLSKLIKFYVENNGDPLWLNNYFKERIQFYSENADYKYTPTNLTGILSELQPNHGSLVNDKILIKTILPHYFRGFKDINHPINIESKLLIIEGRNSQGKTSLGESIEWLFTGRLSRRNSKDFGDSRELENCISNTFRPPQEDTWVEATFSKNNESIKIKRKMVKDYGRHQNDFCSSVLYLNDELLSIKKETAFLEQLFGSVPPILMQHTLGDFVRNNPSDRRKYFESLLNLDGLTSLIEKCVIPDETLDGFRFSSDFSRIEKLKNIINKNGNFFYRYSKIKKEAKEEFIKKSLIEIAQKEFLSAKEKCSMDECYKKIKEIAENRKNSEFPLYKDITPNPVSDNLVLNLIKNYDNDQWIDKVKVILGNIKKLKEGKTDIENKKVIINQINKLMEANLVTDSTDSQYCPICNYQHFPTLSVERMNEIKSWLSFTDSLLNKENELENLVNTVTDDFNYAFKTCQSFLPYFPSDNNIEISLKGKTTANMNAEIINKLRISFENIKTILNMIDCNNKYLFGIVKDAKATTDLSEIKQEINTNCQNYLDFIKETKTYLHLFSKMEQTFGASLEEDKSYKKMMDWIHCYNELDLLKKEVDFEISKKIVHEELKTMRQELIELRHQVLERKRSSFNQEISSIWSALRGDRYSTFKSLHIPKPKGRGFPIEINVMAVLDDGTEEKEVDALRIFSESQVHALGIAAFITRSKIMGHKFIIFDDPVQSMDEEHFKTFASKVIKKLLDEDFQVIIFTHSDQFSREISYHYCDYLGYTTMTVRHSRKKGCQIEEGSRRVSERLNKSKKLSEEGNFSEAWKYIRLAIERMYVIIKIKFEPKFVPSSWDDQTADYMWKQGIEKIIDDHKPEMKQRLKFILSMTASGAHDKAPNGETDLLGAINDIKSLLVTLKVSD